MKIYHKSQKRIEQETGEHKFAAKLVKGIAEPVCEYYIVDENNVKRDIWTLTTREIACIIMNCKRFDIIRFINDKQKINNFATLKEIMDLDAHCKTQEAFARLKEVVEALGGNLLLDKARYIAEVYETQVKGNPTNVKQVVCELADYEQRQEKKI